MVLNSVDELKESLRVFRDNLWVVVAGDLNNRIEWVALIEYVISSLHFENHLHGISVQKFTSLQDVAELQLGLLKNFDDVPKALTGNDCELFGLRERWA
jgi:hypothetical protein